MAKATKGLRSQIAEIRAGQRAMNKEAGVEYGVTKSANKAGVANLNAQLGRINRQLQGTTKRTTKNVAHLTQRAKEVERQTRAKQDAAVSRYGTSLGGSVNQQFQTAEATSAAGVQSLRGARSVAARGANMAEGVMGIAAQGAKAQKASGDYALAQALQARYQVSAETAFQAEQDLRLEQLQFEHQKELAKFQAKLDSAEAAGGVPGVTTAVSAAAGSAGDLMELMHKPITAADGTKTYLTGAEAANTYITNAGIQDPNEQAMIRSMAAKMWNQGAGWTENESGEWEQRAGGVNQDSTALIQKAAQQTFATLYPQMWKKHGKDIMGAVGSASTVWALETTKANAGGNEDLDTPPSAFETRVVHSIPFAGPALVRQSASTHLSSYATKTDMTDAEIAKTINDAYGQYIAKITPAQIAAARKSGNFGALIRDL